MSFTVRYAQSADRDGIFAVEQLCSGMPWSKGQIAEELQNEYAHTFVAEADGAVVGFASAHILQGDGHLLSGGTHFLRSLGAQDFKLCLYTGRAIFFQ